MVDRSTSSIARAKNRVFIRRQTVASLLTSASVTGLNLYYGWGRREALMPSAYLIAGYNVFDTLLGWRHYLFVEPIYLLHHLFTFAGAMIAMELLSRDDCLADVERFSPWMLLAEVTTFFNGVRILARHTVLQRGTEVLFGIAFVVGRGAMSLGSLASLYHNAYFALFAPFCAIFNGLNLYWGTQIVRKARGQPIAHPHSRRRVVAPAVLPMVAMYATNQGHPGAALVAWIACILSTYWLW